MTGAEPPRASATAEQVSQLRQELQRVGKEASNTISDDDLRRFFRATGSNMAATAKRLAHTAAWREQQHPGSLECGACKANPSSHYMHLVGHDKLGRPVLYSNFILVGNRNVKTLLDHMIESFETAIRAMPEGVEQWVWLNDFIGFGVGDMNPALALSFINLMAAHYPERLGQLLVMDAPGIMTPVWNFVRPFVDPVTHKKIRFVVNDIANHGKPGKTSQLHNALSELLDEEMLTWVTNEMAAMRSFSRKQGPKPEYNLQQLKASLAKGELPAQGGDAGASAGAGAPAEAKLPEGHSHYGCPSLLRKLLKEPQLLHPAPAAKAPGAAAAE